MHLTPGPAKKAELGGIKHRFAITLSAVSKSGMVESRDVKGYAYLLENTSPTIP